MCSGRKDLRDATTAADLSCHKGLTLAVSELCGGDACRPTAHQILDHEALRSLVYRRFPTMLFSSAETVEGRPPSAKKRQVFRCWGAGCWHISEQLHLRPGMLFLRCHGSCLTRCQADWQQLPSRHQKIELHRCRWQVLGGPRADC